MYTSCCRPTRPAAIHLCRGPPCANRAARAPEAVRPGAAAPDVPARSAQELTPRARDSLVSFGERLSTRIFAAHLRARGVPARQHDAFAARFNLATSDDFGAAEVAYEAALPAVRAARRAVRAAHRDGLPGPRPVHWRASCHDCECKSAAVARVPCPWRQCAILLRALSAGSPKPCAHAEQVWLVHAGASRTACISQALVMCSAVHLTCSIGCDARAGALQAPSRRWAAAAAT